MINQNDKQGNRDYISNLESNIWKFYLFEFLWSLVFFFPIFQLFYLARSMTVVQIAIIGVVYGVARMSMEIPSGILADRWGRKKTLFLSQMFFIIAMIVIILSHSFWLFCIASVFNGFWIACYSGTGVAFFYDTLLELKRENEYEKLYGKLSLITSASSFVAAFVAGFLFNANIILPYILSSLSAFLSLFVISLFTEPKFHRPAEEDNLFLHFRNSMLKITKNEHLGFIVIFGAIFSFSLDYIFSYGQIYLKLINIPVVLFGIIFAFKSIVEGFGSVSASKIKNKFSYRKIFTFILLFAITLVFALSYLNNYFGVFVFLISFFTVGVFRIIQRGYIHKRVDSHNRATVDSLSSFIVAIFAIIFEPIAGKIADIYSIQVSFFLLGCILVVYSVYFFTIKFSKKNLFN